MPGILRTHPWVAEGSTRVRFGVTSGLSEWADLLHFARLLEDLGFDSFWWNDHTTWALDPWTVLTAVALTTGRLRLITLVSCIYYRSPALLARLAADVDRLSGGRLVLGVGIGDIPHEFGKLGLEYPSTRARQAALEEAVRIVQGVWGSEPFTLDGRHFKVQAAAVCPGPVQQPRVPVLIAGGGERVTLRQVAELADVSNFGSHEWTGAAYTLDDVRRKYAALRAHCDDLGRPYDSILRSVYVPSLVIARTRSSLHAKLNTLELASAVRYVPIHATPDQAIAEFQALAGAGAQYFLVAAHEHDEETVGLLAEKVMPEI